MDNQGNYYENQGNQNQPNSNNWNVDNTPHYYTEEPLSMGQWLLTLLVMIIPCVGIIMLFVWGFGEGNQSRRNFCRAALIFSAIVIVIYVVLVILMMGAFMSSRGSLGGYYY